MTPSGAEKTLESVDQPSETVGVMLLRSVGVSAKAAGQWAATVDEALAVLGRPAVEQQLVDTRIGPGAVVATRLPALQAQLDARRQVGSRSRRPEWCGVCDEATRMVEVGEDRIPARCPTCSPARRRQTQQQPARPVETTGLLRSMDAA
jgi:hypothetical protein